MQNNQRIRQRARKRRRARKIKIAIVIIILALAGSAAGVVFASILPSEVINLEDYFTVEFGGFDTSGTATAILDDSAVDELLSTVKEEYDSKLIHFDKVENEDYVNFRKSLTATVSPCAGLSNGSVVTLTCHYDKKLAEKLKIDVDTYEKRITVNELIRATTISNEQLFEDLEVAFTGISPNMQLGVINHSEHPFIKTVTYEIVNAKENYAEGDSVDLLAIFDEKMALDMQYVVDPEASCMNTYVAVANSAYVNSVSDISQSIVQEAISAGARAFVNANEYGVRIFCEGNLVPIYINKQATFQWGSPRALSAYFKVVYPEEAGKLGNNYNDLDIIYECNLTQANGVNCPAYCVVRFSDFIKNGDGTISYDFSNPKIMSASYFSARVKKNVVDSYLNKYEIEKIY